LWLTQIFKIPLSTNVNRPQTTCRHFLSVDVLKTLGVTVLNYFKPTIWYWQGAVNDNWPECHGWVCEQYRWLNECVPAAAVAHISLVATYPGWYLDFQVYPHESITK